MLHRRSVLELLAATPLGLAGCANTSNPDPIAAWRDPGAGEADVRRWALAHAVLAPNPHNRQPWLVELEGSDALRLYVDLERRLPATDPPNRQITLGCGAFLELLDLAARQKGYRLDLALWPEGEPQPVLDARPVAQMRFVADPAIRPDPLFAQITRRHTNRQPFDAARPPTQAELNGVTAVAPMPLSAGSVTDPALRDRLIEIGSRAFTIEGRTPGPHMESVRLMRIGADEIARHRDGISLDGPMIEGLKTLGLMTPAAMADPDSFASRSGHDMWLKMLAATPAFVWLKGPDNSRRTQVLAGRAYARMHLTATALGLSMHPWSMALQEFPEMAGPYRETQGLLNATPAAPLQMLVRIGRAAPAKPSPRRGLAEHLRT